MTRSRDWFGLVRPAPRDDEKGGDIVIQGFAEDQVDPIRAPSIAARLRDLSRQMAPVTEGGEALDRLAVLDSGDVAGGSNAETVRRFLQQRFEAIPPPLFPLHLASDRSLTVPLVEAFARRQKGRCSLLLLDAHTNLLEPERADAPAQSTLRRLLDLSTLSVGKPVVAGARCFASGEADAVRRQGVVCLYARDLQLKGAERVALQAVESLYEADSVYLSLDVDVLDPAFLPGAVYAAPAGLTPRELLTFLRTIFGKLRIEAMDLVGLSPDFCENSGRLVLRILLETFGFVLNRRERLSL